LQEVLKSKVVHYFRKNIVFITRTPNRHFLTKLQLRPKALTSSRSWLLIQFQKRVCVF